MTHFGSTAQGHPETCYCSGRGRLVRSNGDTIRCPADDSPAGGQPPSDGPDELEQIRKIVLAICDEPEDDAPYVIVGEDGTPIVEADTLPEAIEQIIACWNAVELRLDRVGPSDGMPSEPSEEAIAAAMSFADGDAASHTSIRGGDYSRKEWTRLFLAAAYAAERGVSAVPPTEE
jgi:hypothetical protein